MRVEVISAIRVSDGDLVMSVGTREIRQKKPVVYQEIDGTRRPIDANYVLRDGARVGFDIGAYDHNRSLIIDPQLIYSLYLSGEQILGVAIDTAGNAYICGAVQDSYNENVTDAFIIKLNSTGTAVIYSNVFGAPGVFDQANGIAVDASGNAYVTGHPFGDAPARALPTANPIERVHS